MKKRWWIAVVVIIGLAGLAYGGYAVIQRRAARSEAVAANGAVETAVVERGDLRASIEGSGSIAAVAAVDLAFATTGTVADVRVAVGDIVVAGQPLAHLDITDLVDAVSEAEISLEQAQVQLAKTKDGPSDEDINAAEASLNAAKADYWDVAAGPTEDEIAQAEIDLRQAEIALESAQAAYDRAGGGWRVEVDYTNTATNLWQAQANYEAALASYAATMEGAASTERWAAWAKVEQSQASLDKLLASPAEEDVRLAEISVEQAELSLAQARHNLELATLIAPIGGVVTQVNVEEGSTAGGIAIVISDLNALAVELSLDESDVAQVLEGQSAVITLEAFDDVELSGAVVYVAPTANIQSGVVLYDVTVVIDPAGVAVRVGMTADVEIISVDVEDVLLIPAGAVQTLGQRTIVLRELAEGEAAPLPAMENRETLQAGEGMTLTERMAGAGAGRLAQLASGFAPVPVELGARSETHVEVISGLEEGDVVVLTDLAEITEQMGGMGPFGGARPFGGAFGGARP